MSVLSVKDMTKEEDFPINGNLTEILQYCLCESSDQLYLVTALNEEAKNFSAAALVERILGYIKDKSSSINFTAIDKSAGDFKKCSILFGGEDQLYEAYKKVYASIPNNSSIPAFVIVSALERNIVAFTKQWKRAYALKEDNNIMLYRSLCMLFSMCLSGIITNCVQFTYTKDSSANTVPQLSHKIPANFEKTYYIRSAARMNQLFSSGKIEKYLEQSNKVQPLQESVLSILATAGFGVVLFLSVLGTIRELILYFFHCRRRLAQEFKVGAEYLAMRASFESNEKDSKKALELSQSFMKVSDAFNFSQKKDEATTVREVIKEQEKDMKLVGNKEFPKELLAANPSASGLLL